jgi:hypothetical protein
LIPGCQQETVQVESTPARVETVSGKYLIQYQFNPDSVPKNEHFSVKISLSLKNENTMPDGLTIKVNADMPSHGHGMNTEPEIKQLSSGEFLVDGLLFHMGGDWELYIDVMEDGIPDRATIPLKL